jgi:hypothetical protein
MAHYRRPLAAAAALNTAIFVVEVSGKGELVRITD